MVLLADARDSQPDGFLREVDEQLDGLAFRLDELRRAGALSGLGQRRGLNLIAELRSRLEAARNGQDVRQAFHDLDGVRGVVDEAEQIGASDQG
jgi:hypothetical protein